MFIIVLVQLAWKFFPSLFPSSTYIRHIQCLSVWIRVKDQMIGKKRKKKERRRKWAKTRKQNQKKVMGEFAATKTNLPAILLFFRLIDCLCVCLNFTYFLQLSPQYLVDFWLSLFFINQPSLSAWRRISVFLFDQTVVVDFFYKVKNVM